MTFTATPTATASAATRWGGPAALGLALMAALGVTALLSSGTNISSTSVASSSTKLARGANTPATTLATSDKTVHTQCLADQVETNDGLYEGAVKTFLESQGQNYTKGGHFDGLLQAGLLTQGVPGVPQDPLTPRRGPLGPSLDRERAIRNAPAL